VLLLLLLLHWAVWHCRLNAERWFEHNSGTKHVIDGINNVIFVR